MSDSVKAFASGVAMDTGIVTDVPALLFAGDLALAKQLAETVAGFNTLTSSHLGSGRTRAAKERRYARCVVCAYKQI